MARNQRPETSEQGEEQSSQEMCGHKNAHFVPAKLDGKPVQSADLTCTLSIGHEGDHSAEYKTVKNGEAVISVAYWKDEAG